MNRRDLELYREALAIYNLADHMANIAVASGHDPDSEPGIQALYAAADDLIDAGGFRAIARPREESE